MKKIVFSKEEKAEIVGRIRQYFADELDQAIGVLPAEFLSVRLDRSDEFHARHGERRVTCHMLKEVTTIHRHRNPLFPDVAPNLLAREE